MTSEYTDPQNVEVTTIWVKAKLVLSIIGHRLTSEYHSTSFENESTGTLYKQKLEQQILQEYRCETTETLNKIIKNIHQLVKEALR